MTETCINQFRNYLRSEEKAEANIGVQGVQTR